MQGKVEDVARAEIQDGLALAFHGAGVIGGGVNVLHDTISGQIINRFVEQLTGDWSRIWSAESPLTWSDAMNICKYIDPAMVSHAAYYIATMGKSKFEAVVEAALGAIEKTLIVQQSGYEDLPIGSGFVDAAGWFIIKTGSDDVWTPGPDGEYRPAEHKMSARPPVDAFSVIDFPIRLLWIGG